jgi:phospholipid transport system transporter-binding protein
MNEAAENVNETATLVAPETITLAAEEDISVAAALKERLVEAHETGASAVTIDGSAVGRIDTAALQLLVAFARDRRAAGGSVAWIRPSETLVRAATTAGLTSALGLD